MSVLLYYVLPSILILILMGFALAFVVMLGTATFYYFKDVYKPMATLKGVQRA
jgi:hypothetical protein